MAMMGHTRQFTSRTVSGMLVLLCLTLIRTLTGTSVHRDVRRDGVERHDRQMTPAHGASDGQGRDEKLSLLTSIGSMGPTLRRRRTQRSWRTSSSRSILFLHYNPCFPLDYKRESRASHKGHRNSSQHTTGDSNPINPSNPKHTTEQ